MTLINVIEVFNELLFFFLFIAGSNSTLSASDAARRRSWDLPKGDHDILGKSTCVHRSPCTSFSVPNAARRRHRSEPRVICSYPGPIARWRQQISTTIVRLNCRGLGGHENWKIMPACVSILRGGTLGTLLSYCFLCLRKAKTFKFIVIYVITIYFIYIFLFLPFPAPSSIPHRRI